MEVKERLFNLIPGGAHTYSRNQFPDNAPSIFEGGDGAYLFTPDGEKFLDYGMGLRAVTCGYGEQSIIQGAMEGMLLGNCLSRASTIELNAAELMVGLIDSFDMVKFTKTGSAATTGAVKLARAFTGKEVIMIANQPFFSYDDWFIGTTKRNKGISSTKTHKFSNLFELEISIDCMSIAAVIMEPDDSYDLKAIRELCTKNGIVLIFDEMITGFRYDIGGAQKLYDVKPDISCFGKAMANGFSVSCLGGKREIMQLGGDDDMFLLSTTHGAEMCGLAAFMSAVKFMKEKQVIEHLHWYGRQFRHMIDKLVAEIGIVDFKLKGHVTNPSYSLSSAYRRTLFQQELVKHGVLMPWIAFSYAHNEEQLEHTENAIKEAFKVLAIDKGDKLEGNVITPVFG